MENGNPEAMWNAMIAIKKRGKSSFSDTCIEWVKREFDRDKNYQKYLELYKQIGSK